MRAPSDPTEDDDVRLAAWVVVCCILGGLAVILVAATVSSCA